MSAWGWPNFSTNVPPSHVYMPPGMAQPSFPPGHVPPPTNPWLPNFFPTTNHGPPIQPPPWPQINPQINPYITAGDKFQFPVDMKKDPKEMPKAHYELYGLQPATSPVSFYIHIISRDFPWSMNVDSRQPLSCANIWSAIYNCLATPLVDSEWGLILLNPGIKQTMEKAAKRRRKAGDTEKRFRRIDYLGDATIFKGLEKDEEFAKSRRVPGEDPVPYDVWVVKMGTS